MPDLARNYQPAQTLELSGTLRSLVSTGDAILVQIVLPSGEMIYIDDKLVPGGGDWVMARIGKAVQLRTIVRELQAGPRR